MLQVFLPAPADSKAVEKLPVIHRRAASQPLILEETPDHRKVQRLAEPARTGKQGHLGIRIQKLLQHPCLIHEVSVFIDDFFEILHPNRDDLSFFSVHALRFLSSLISLHVITLPSPIIPQKP